MGIIKSLLLSIKLLFATALAAQTKTLADTTLIMVIDGVNVYQAELNREMKACRAKVFSEYAAIHNSGAKADFRDRAMTAKRLLAEQKKRAIRILINLKVQERLLIAKHLWPYKNYDDLISDMHAQNIERKEAYLNDQVIYGPINFTEETFYHYQFSNALIKLKNVLKDREIPLDESLLKKHFEGLRKSIYKSPSYQFENVRQQVTDHYIETKYQQMIIQLSLKTQIKQLKNN